MSSPRMRRLEADYQAIRSLCRESSILEVSCSGQPPSTYLLQFTGRGLAFEAGTGIQEQMEHSVRIRLGSGYPRQIPELHWLTPIFHPNISANGLVCLGGYTTNWVPSLKLDDLCQMLWDMIRYRNFDPASPYNRMAAEWARSQRDFILPLDSRPLRDRRVSEQDLRPELDPQTVPVSSLDQRVEEARKDGFGVTNRSDSYNADPNVVDSDLPNSAGVDPGVELVDAEEVESATPSSTDDRDQNPPDILFIS